MLLEERYVPDVVAPFLDSPMSADGVGGPGGGDRRLNGRISELLPQEAGRTALPRKRPRSSWVGCGMGTERDWSEWSDRHHRRSPPLTQTTTVTGTPMPWDMIEDWHRPIRPVTNPAAPSPALRRPELAVQKLPCDETPLMAPSRYAGTPPGLGQPNELPCCYAAR